MDQAFQRVRVTRPFRYMGDDAGVGSVIDLEAGIALELRNARKCVFVSSAELRIVPPAPKPKQARAPAEDLGLADLDAAIGKLTDQVASLIRKA